MNRIPRMSELRPVEKALKRLFKRLHLKAPAHRAQSYVARIVELEMAEALGLPVGHA